MKPFAYFNVNPSNQHKKVIITCKKAGIVGVQEKLYTY